MAIAATNNLALRIIEEVTFGTTPATPLLKGLRFTGESLIANKETAVSEVIRNDRQRDFLAEVAASGEGDINVEIAFGDELDTQLEGVLQEDLVDNDSGAGTIATLEMTIVAAARTFTRSDGGSFVTDGFVVGMWFRAAGHDDPGNNGIFHCEAVTATVLTATATFGDVGALVDETTVGTTSRFFNRRISNGTTLKSYTIEKDWNDITQFQTFQGMRYGQLALTVEVGSIATGVWTLSGKGNVQMDPSRTNVATTGAVTPTEPDTTDQLNATSNVGQLIEGGVVLTTCVESVAIQVANNLRNINCVGSKFPNDVNAGFVDVTGTLTAYFEDKALFDKFLNHTQSSFAISMSDAAGNEIVITMPRIFFGSGSPVAGGGNDDVRLEMEFTAIREQITGGDTIHFDIMPIVLP